MSELRTRRCAQEHPACTEGLLSDVRNASQGKCAAWIAARVLPVGIDFTPLACGARGSREMKWGGALVLESAAVLWQSLRA
eukprot:scaffold113803_cov18-Tisochrysis_lutea.AAC.1